jgi:tetratricopeptide (TPR) repeat protein
MRSKKQIINFILAFSLISSTVFFANGQNFKKELKSGEIAFKEARYKDAAGFYNNATLFVKKPNKKHLSLYYKLGYCEMRSGEYKKANNSYLRYLSLAKNFPPPEKQLAQVNEWNSWCETELRTDEKELREEDVTKDIEVESLMVVNSALNDYGAIFVDENRILFTSNRPTDTDKNLEDINDDIYVVYYDKGTYSEPMRVRMNLNTKYEDMASSFCEATQTLYFTISEDNNKTCNIYTSQKSGNNWSAPIQLGTTINSVSWDGYPSISKDGKTLYFVSDRPGGVGGKDIYVSTLKSDGSWSDAKNMGRAINTRLDEITPHIDPSGYTLYFSSNRSEGFGGFDIYYSEFEASNMWGDAKNMKTPVNSAGNDIFYITTNEDDMSFFSSNRKNGAGLYDIYIAKPLAKPAEDSILVDETKEVEDKDIRPGISETDIAIEDVTKSEQPAITPKPTTDGTGAKLNSSELHNAQVEGLHFKVQLGAFRRQITVNHPYFTERIEATSVKEEQWPPDMLYKYTTGMYYTINSATEYKMQIRVKGFADAFLTCYYNNQRISMDEAKNVIRNNYNKNQVSIK